MKKRWLAAVLSFSLIVSMFASPVFAEELPADVQQGTNEEESNNPNPATAESDTAVDQADEASEAQADVAASESQAGAEAPDSQAGTGAQPNEAPSEAPDSQAGTEVQPNEEPSETPDSQAGDEAQPNETPSEAPDSQAGDEAQPNGAPEAQDDTGSQADAESQVDEAPESDPEGTQNASVTAPATVKGLNATSAGKNRVRLSWTAVSGAEGYLVYGKTAQGTYGYKGMTTKGTTFTDTKASDSEWTFYWVFAYVKDTTGKMVTGGCEKYVFGKGICPAVTGLKVSATSYTDVTLSWNAVATAEGYLVYGKTANGTYGYKGMTTKGTKWSDTKASAEEYNFYWVFPYHKDQNGNMIVGGTAPYVYGKKQAYTQQVTGLKAVSMSTYVKLTWNAVPNAKGYLIYRKVGNGTFQYRYMVTGTSFSDTTASAAEYNFYKVYPYIMAGDTRLVGKCDNYVFGKPTKINPAVEYPAFNVGSVTATIGSSQDAEVGHTAYTGKAGKDYTDKAVYTFNDLIDTTQLNWNPLNWATSSDDQVLRYLSIGFYEFVLNSTKDGWAVVPEMAAAYPVDVTSNYVGKFGIKQGETSKAFKVALNPDAAWEDGTPIDADSYLYSYQQLMDPAQYNRRADSLYTGESAIFGAKAYYYQGRSAFQALGMSTSEYLKTGSVKDLYLDAVGFWNAADYIDANGNEIPAYLPVTDETIYSVDGTNTEAADAFSAKSLYEEYFAPGSSNEDYAADYLGIMKGYPSGVSFDSVGIVKTGKYELVFIFQEPITSPSYYVPYYLPMYLVKEDLYESLKNNQDGYIYSSYGTSVDTTASYGPYRLQSIDPDHQIAFTRNENWYGYKDGKHTGQYQADNVCLHVISLHETALLAFLNGEIDTIGLQQQDMAAYASSKYLRFEPQSYTTKLTFNTDEASLKGRGTQVLGNLNFRNAFSLAIDRSTFASSFTGAGSAGYGLLNYMYVYDPFTGASYRNSDAAKAALCDLYGLTYGPGGTYSSVDAAYNAITGYDLQKARELMKIAYTQVTSDGTWDGKTPISITLSVYQNDDIYTQMCSYLDAALKDACIGTGFEGKVGVTMKADPDYYSTMYNGETDMIFSSWGGAAYSPFTILYECYCDAGSTDLSNQMEYGFDTNAVKVTLTINGKAFTQSLQKWALWMDGDTLTTMTSNDGSLTLNAFSSYDADTKCAIFAKMEYVYLANYATTPLYYRNSGSLISQKGDYPVTEYVDMIGFGGLRYYTFNYDDAAWASVGASLQY